MRVGRGKAARSRSTRRRVAVAAAAVAVAGVAGVYAVVIHPWVTLPAPEEEIDAAWDEVRAWAFEGAGTVELEGARRAARMIRPRTDEIRTELAADTDLPEIPADQLRPVESDAVSALVAWSEAAAEADEGELCADVDMSADRASIELLTLGRLALASAGADPSSEHVRAVARLGRYLRERGGLLDAMIGAALAESVASWGKSRRVPLSAPVASSLKIREGDYFSVLARESYCTAEWIDSLFSDEAERARERFDGVLRAGPPWAMFRPRREVLVLKAYYADLLARVHRHRDDLDAMAAELDAIDEEKPVAKSLLLDVLKAPYAYQAREWSDYAAKDLAAPAPADVSPPPDREPEGRGAAAGVDAGPPR